MFLLPLSTGLRVGELLALEYSDFSNGNVIVNEQLNSHYKINEDRTRTLETTVKDVKSSSSNRSIPIPQSVMKEFEEYKKWHEAEMLLKGYRTTYPFTTDVRLGSGI